MLEQLRAGIAAAGARDLSVIDAPALGVEVLELRQLAAALQAEYVRSLAEFERRQGYADEQLTAAAWLQVQTTISRGQAHADVRIARVLDKLPATAEVYATGELTDAHLHAIVAALRRLPDELWLEVDGPLATVARVKTAHQLADWLRELAQSLVPTPAPPDE